MITKEEVLQALSYIYDAEYHRPAVELRLIRDILVKEGRVNLTFLLTRDDDQLKDQYSREVREALSRAGAAEVNVRFRLMTEYERREAEAAEQGGSPEGDAKARRQPSAASGRQPAGSILQPASGTRFIAVASGKGGVGKSTVTVNLAAALARKGKAVGLIDADIYGFSVPDMMGIEENPMTENDKILPVERFGVKVMSMGFFVQENAPVIWRGPMLGKMLQNFFAEVEWGPLDYMLLDLPPGTGDIALDVHQMIPQSREILVTTPHPTASFVAARAGAMARQTNHDIVGVVENMAYYVNRLGEKEYVFGRGGGAKLAEELHTELLAQIPLGAPDNPPGEPDYSPSVYPTDSETGKLYEELADRIIGKLG